RNAGVSAGGFDKRIAGLDIATRFRMANHGACSAIFNRARRVIAFELGQDDIASRRAQFSWEALPTNKWRGADGIFDSQVRFHAGNHTPIKLTQSKKSHHDCRQSDTPT